MIIEWLAQISVDLTLIILVIIALRPIVRRFLGAHITYWLWLIPLIRVTMIERLPLASPSLLPVPLDFNKGVVEIYLNNAATSTFQFPWLTLWLTGVILWVGFRFTTGWRFQRQCKRRRKLIATPDIYTHHLPKKFQRLTKSIGIYTTSMMTTPFVTGLIRPAIYLPEGFFKRFSSDQQAWIITHELNHIRRGDLWIQAAYEGLRALFWFHPAIHIAHHCLREDQELACDHSLLKNRDSQDRYRYGKTLILSSLSSSNTETSPSTLTFFGRNKRRFKMLDKHQNSKLRTFIGLSFFLILGFFSITQPAVLAAQSDIDTALTTPISLSFENTPTGDVVTEIAELVDINLVAPDAFRSQNITLNFDDIRAIDALDIVVRFTGFDYELNKERNLVIIVPVNEEPI